jgi:hypothetical protein
VVQCSSLTQPVVKHILVIDIGVDYEGSSGAVYLFNCTCCEAHSGNRYRC